MCTDPVVLFLVYVLAFRLFFHSCNVYNSANRIYWCLVSVDGVHYLRDVSIPFRQILTNVSQREPCNIAANTTASTTSAATRAAVTVVTN